MTRRSQNPNPQQGGKYSTSLALMPLRILNIETTFEIDAEVSFRRRELSSIAQFMDTFLDLRHLFFLLPTGSTFMKDAPNSDDPINCISSHHEFGGHIWTVPHCKEEIGLAAKEKLHTYIRPLLEAG